MVKDLNCTGKNIGSGDNYMKRRKNDDESYDETLEG